MRNTALRMSISWIMYATPSSRSYAKTCPRAFWTKTGRHLLPLLLRYKQRAAQLTNMYMNWVCRVINSNLHCQFCGALQASEHLRRLHMRNMVMKYCKRVQPEWKKQVYWLQNAWSHFLFLFLWTCIFFILLDFFFSPPDDAEGCSQWDLQGSERQLPSECWQVVFGLQTRYVFIHCTYNRKVYLCTFTTEMHQKNTQHLLSLRFI